MTIYTFDMKKFWISFLAFIIALLLAIVFAKSKEIKTQKDNISALNSEAKKYTLKNGQLVLSVENLNYTKEQLKQEVLSKDKKLKELANKFSSVRTTTKYITNTQIDTIRLTYKDTVPCIFKREGSIVEKEYSISYNSNQKGIEIKDLKIIDSVMIVTGIKRKWFLGKETQNFDISHSNKYINTSEVQHIQVIQPKKWYDSSMLKVAVGFLGGYFITR